MSIKQAAVRQLKKLFKESFSVNRYENGAKGMAVTQNFSILGRLENDQKLIKSTDNREVLSVGVIFTFTKLLADSDQVTIGDSEYFVNSVNENKDENGEVVFYECYLRKSE